MQDKIIDLRQGKQAGRKWFDIKKAISLSIGEKRKQSKLIKLLNRITLAVLIVVIICVGLRFILQNKPKTIVFYDLLPDNLLSFSLINDDVAANSKVIGSILDGIDVFNEPFSSINAEITAETSRVLKAAQINVENEILPCLGRNMGIVTTKTNDKKSFILFVELKNSLKDEDISYTKSRIEKELKNTYNVVYTTYNDVSIASISNFNPDMGFSWLNGHYAFIDQYFILSDSLENIKQIINKNS